jgi:hypothetical protein
MVVLTMTAILSPALRAAAGEVDLNSLLNEMVNRDALAQWPVPGYTLKEASSHDRSKTDPSNLKTWHNNHDSENFIRTETNEGRKEWVIMKDQGPGAITRFWTPLLKANKAQIIRFYFDGATTPSLSVNFFDLISGKAFVPPPLAFESWNQKDVRDQATPTPDLLKNADQGIGADFYLPITFAKSCKITLDSLPFYYVINYRMYDPATVVKTFSMDGFTATKATLDRVATTLLNDAAPVGTTAIPNQEATLGPNATMTFALPKGPSAVCQLNVQINPKDAPQVLRSTILQATFDGNAAIWCPLGEFFGAGARLNPIRDWDRTVKADGSLVARWVMPYQRTASISLQNLGSTPVKVSLSALSKPWKWDDRSMIFHANWHSQHDIRTRPRSDWSYVEVHGRGVYVGDTLTVYSPVKAWYGEGDERIYLDGEKVSSMIGTGTEDYYGYAWGMPDYFNSPFLSTPQRDHSRNDWRGYTTDSKLRLLDAIPFRTELKHDMEIWDWAETEVDYAAGLFWYAFPGATHNRTPQPDEARLAVKAVPGNPPDVKIPGAIECESLPKTSSPGVTFDIKGTEEIQASLSGNKELFVGVTKPGDFVELEIPVPDGQPHKVTLYVTERFNYGIMHFTINSQPAGKDFDSYNNEARDSGPIELGTFTPKDGKMYLRVTSVGANPASAGNYFGLDCVVLGVP